MTSFMQLWFGWSAFLDSIVIDAVFVLFTKFVLPLHNVSLCKTIWYISPEVSLLPFLHRSKPVTDHSHIQLAEDRSM